MKPRLLAIELWGIGDLALAAPFVAAARNHYEVTVLVKRSAMEPALVLMPGVEILSVNTPWTSFHGKYQLQHWPWSELRQMISELRRRRFDVAVSARFDPRDHLILWLTRAENRLGFPRRGSNMLLTRSMGPADRRMHRFLAWQRLGEAVGVKMFGLFPQASDRDASSIVVHTGAGHTVRVWPLERFAWMVHELRKRNYEVRVVCDPDQRQWWLDHGELSLSVPHDLGELAEILQGSRIFIGNDSGPGHVAALWGVPTFTVFGPQLPESFAPIHPLSEWVEGKPCKFKPCFDRCRYESPYCLTDLTEQEVWPRIEAFAQKHVSPRSSVEVAIS